MDLTASTDWTAIGAMVVTVVVVVLGYFLTIRSVRQQADATRKAIEEENETTRHATEQAFQKMTAKRKAEGAARREEATQRLAAELMKVDGHWGGHCGAGATPGG